MYWQAMRTPALPGENDVTDGSVDYYDTDWENVDNSALEEEMQKCGLTPCEGKTVCPDNTPAQTDLSAYEIVSDCLLYTSPSPRDSTSSRMPSSA